MANVDARRLTEIRERLAEFDAVHPKAANCEFLTGCESAEPFYYNAPADIHDLLEANEELQAIVKGLMDLHEGKRGKTLADIQKELAAKGLPAL